MPPSVVVLGTQIRNIKMRSSKLIIKSIAQNVMAKFGFGQRFHNLKCFEVGFLFHIPWIHYKLEGTITNISKYINSIFLIF